jgi:hypothetical protein
MVAQAIGQIKIGWCDAVITLVVEQLRQRVGALSVGGALFMTASAKLGSRRAKSCKWFLTSGRLSIAVRAVNRRLEVVGSGSDVRDLVRVLDVVLGLRLVEVER